MSDREDPRATTHPTNPDFTAAGFERHVIRPDVNGNVADRCGWCTLLPTVTGYTRATQARCPMHGNPGRLAAVQAAIRRTHHPLGDPAAEGNVWCACDKLWPCETVLATSAAVGDFPS